MSGPPDFRLEHSEFRAAGEFASEDLPYHPDWRGSLEKLPWALDEEARSGWSISTRTPTLVPSSGRTCTLTQGT